MASTSDSRPRLPYFLTILASVVFGLLLHSSPSLAQEETAQEETELNEAEQERLRAGAEVYSQTCSSCHQPGGAGVAGQFPPLIDNPSVADTEYVTSVINNGLQGEITSAGQTFDGVMPAFSTLSADDIADVIAYMQSGFAPLPTIEGVENASGPVAESDSPAILSIGALVALLLAAAVVALVVTSRVIGARDSLDMPWAYAWLKAAVIVLSVVFFTVILPDWVIKSSTVAKLDRLQQEAITVGLWSVGLVLVLWGLWYSRRNSRA